jgi:hypothetical protein
MALKKSELYSSLWSSCDELRGAMDASQYKDYVLVLLFIKYVSDKYTGQPYAPITIPPSSASLGSLSCCGTKREQFKPRRVDSPLHGTDAKTLANSCGRFSLPGGGSPPSITAVGATSGNSYSTATGLVTVPCVLIYAHFAAQSILAIARRSGPRG